MPHTNSIQEIIRKYLEQTEGTAEPQINNGLKTILQRAGFTQEEISTWLELFYTYTTANILLRFEEAGLLEKANEFAHHVKSLPNFDAEELTKLQTGKYEDIFKILKVSYDTCLKEFLATTYKVDL